MALGVADLVVYTGALLGLTAFVAAVLQVELEMGAFISTLTAVSVTSAGLMVALALQVALEVPFVWSFGTLATVVLSFAVLYELFT